MGSEQNWSFAQDKRGVLYVANNDGVLQYDGEKWGLIPLPGQNYAFSIAFDSRERLYVGSYNELGYLQGGERGSHRFHSLLNLLPPAYRNVRNIVQILVFNDTVFFKGPDYIYLYSNETFKIFPSTNSRLAQLRDGVFLQDGEGLHVYKNAGFQPADPDKAPRDVRINRIKSYIGNTGLLLDDRNSLWVFDPGAAAGKPHLFSSGLDTVLKGSPILTMTYLDNGTVALLLDRGLLFVDTTGVPVNFISNDMFGADIRYARFFQDMRHNLWMTGTDNYIFQVITSSPLSYYDKGNGILGDIISVGSSPGYRYVGTTKGVFYQGKDKTFEPVPGISAEVWNFYTFQGRQYVAAGTGVFRLDGAKAEKLIEQTAVHSLCALRGRPDCFLMGTYNEGIWLLQKKGDSWHKVRIRGFEEESRYIQEDPDGNIWIGHFNKGVFKLRLNERMDSITHKTLYDDVNGLPSKTNNRLYRLQNGDLIVTTTDGIYSYRTASDRFEPVERFRRALPKGACIYTIAESPDGDIYFRYGTAQYRNMAGCLRRQPDGHFSLVQAPFYKIAVPTHGLRIDSDEPLLIPDPREVWLGTSEKLIVYSPGKKTFYDEPLRLFIDRVWAGDSLLSKRGPDQPRPDLPFGSNRLRFGLLSSDYESPEKVQYQYMLDGFEHQWSDRSLSKEAVFTNLREGSYVFWARATNMYGMVSQPVSFSFRIRAPWYRTWWGYSLYMMLLLSFVYVMIRINTTRVTRKNRALEAKVEEKAREIIGQAKVLRELNATKDKLFSIISHDLRGPIGTMKAVVDLMKDSAMSEQDMRSFSVELSDHLLVTGHLLNNLLFWAKTQMEGMRSLPTCFDIQEIAAENCQLFKTLTEGKGIRLINSIHMGTGVYADRNIIEMVLRNLINNAVKFTAAGGEIMLAAAVRGDQVEIVIKDTGVGLTAEEIVTILHKQVFHKPDTEGKMGAGLGLMLCMELIEKDGVPFEIASERGKGSRFSFTVPSCSIRDR